MSLTGERKVERFDVVLALLVANEELAGLGCSRYRLHLPGMVAPRAIP